MSHLKVDECDEDWTTASYLGPGGQSRQLYKISSSYIKTEKLSKI